MQKADATRDGLLGIRLKVQMYQNIVTKNLIQLDCAGWLEDVYIEDGRLAGPDLMV